MGASLRTHATRATAILLPFLVSSMSAACGSDSGDKPDQPTPEGQSPPGIETVPGPNFGKEGEPYCPSSHFCLERPRSTLGDLRGVAAAKIGDLWAVGSGGTILHSNTRGALWARVDEPTHADLNAVSIADDIVWIVGNGGAILRAQDSKLEVAPSPTDADLQDVWAVSRSEAWAVGTREVDGKSRGVALRFDGQAWAEINAGELPPLYAVHGTKPGEPWVAGGYFEPTVLRFDGAAFASTGLSGALSRQTEGPVRGLLVRASGEVIATSDGVNFSNVFLFDGASWSVDLAWRSDRPESGFARILERSDGSVVVTSDPPIVRAGPRDWKPLDDAIARGEAWRAMAESGSTLVLVGDDGHTARWGTPEAEGPFGRARGTGFAGVSFVATQNGVWAHRGDAFSPILAVTDNDNNTVHMDALAPDNVVASSWIFSTGQFAEPTKLKIVRYDGANIQTIIDDASRRYMIAEIAAGTDGSVYYADFGTGSDYPLKQVMPGTHSGRPVQCGDHDTMLRDYNAMQSTPTGVVVRTAEQGGTNYLIQAGKCSPLPAFAWDTIAPDGAGGFYTLSHPADETILGRFDGAAWRELARATTPEAPGARQWLVFGPKKIIILDASATGAALLRYDGQRIAPLVRDGLLEGAAIWGSDLDHLFVGDKSGHIYRYRP